MKIVFPHIPKCAGSSVQKQLKARNDVFLDYSNNPLCMHEPDRVTGASEQQALLERLTTMDSWIAFGHFACSAYNQLPYDRLIILLRSPLERAVSHFFFIKNTLVDDDQHRLGYPEVGPIKDGQMSIDQYLELDHVRSYYSKYYLKDMIVDERVVALPVEQLTTSFQTIAKLSDIRLDASVWSNKGKYESEYESHRGKFAEDDELMVRLIDHTEREVLPVLLRGGTLRRVLSRLSLKGK
ncbi:MAG: hypothetical protein AAF802_05640 [Planctomycetota bacterium]